MNWAQGLEPMLERLLPKAGFRAQQVLSFLANKGMPKELNDRAVTLANSIAVRGLRQTQNISRTDAMLRVMNESLIDLGALPEQAYPKKGVFEFVRPLLPAKLSNRILGLPNNWASPAYVGEHVFGAASNPALDMAEAHEKFLINSHYWTKSLAQSVGKVTDPRKSREWVRDMTGAYAQALPHLRDLHEAEGRLAALLKEAKGVEIAVEGEISPLEETRRLITGLRDKIGAIRQPVMEKWARQSASTRIALAASGEDNWVLPLLQGTEREAAADVRKLVATMRRGRSVEGYPDAAEGFFPHFTGSLHHNLRKTHPELYEGASNLFKLPNRIRWDKRSPASYQWWPAVQEFQHYIPEISRRLAFTPVLKKWRPVWQELSQSGFGQVSKYFRDYMGELTKGEYIKGAGRLTEMLTGFEYFGKVGFSPSVAFKHLWKATRLLAMHPLSTIKTAPQLLSMVKGGVVRRFGLEPGAAYRLTSQMLQARALFHGFTGMNSSLGYWKHIGNLVAASPTMLVEAGERGLAILSTIQKGMAQNMPLDTIQQQLYHTLLNVSFLGQVDRYPWLKTPLQRLFFLFWYTPTRITETTAKWLMYSVLPEKALNEAKLGFWKSLAEYPKALAGKSEVMKMRRDPFGATYASHVAKNAAILGGAAMLASSYTGIDPLSFAKIGAAHLPMLREGPTGTTFVPPPIYDIPTQIQRAGGLNPDNFRAAVVNHYALYGPMTLRRLLEKDIPKMYYGGPLPPEFYYTVKIPPQETLEAMQAKYKRQTAKSAKRFRGHMEKYARYNPMSPEFWRDFADWVQELARMAGG